jgi:sugar/nucleoside kinase (ribokinase family)
LFFFFLQVTKIGTDSFGQDTLKNFRASGVDTGTAEVHAHSCPLCFFSLFSFLPFLPFSLPSLLAAHVHCTSEASTGVAPIAVDADGRNSIIVVNGANDLLTTADIDAAEPVIAAAKVTDACCIMRLSLPHSQKGRSHAAGDPARGHAPRPAARQEGFFFI